MSTRGREKPVAILRAPMVDSSDPTDLKARFEAVTTEIAAELRVVSDRITNDIMNAIAGASDYTEAVRETVFVAVSLNVFENSSKEFPIGWRLPMSDQLRISCRRSIRSWAQAREHRYELHQ